MKMQALAFGLAALLPALAMADPPAFEAPAKPWPSSKPHCQNTTVTLATTRLESGGQPQYDSGVALRFANGVSAVDYQPGNPIAMREREGDKVQTCLYSVPKNCPPGDDRGKVYRVYDYRLQAAYYLPATQHSCGGA